MYKKQIKQIHSKKKWRRSLGQWNTLRCARFEKQQRQHHCWRNIRLVRHRSGGLRRLVDVSATRQVTYRLYQANSRRGALSHIWQTNGVQNWPHKLLRQVSNRSLPLPATDQRLYERHRQLDHQACQPQQKFNHNTRHVINFFLPKRTHWVRN